MSKLIFRGVPFSRLFGEQIGSDGSPTSLLPADCSMFLKFEKWDGLELCFHTLFGISKRFFWLTSRLSGVLIPAVDF